MFPMKVSERNMAVARMRRDGETLDVISKIFHISMERVRQIYTAVQKVMGETEFPSVGLKKKDRLPPWPRTCAVCSKAFTPTVHTHKMCGEECRKIYRRAWNREWMKQYWRDMAVTNPAKYEQHKAEMRAYCNARRDKRRAARQIAAPPPAA